VVGTGGRPAVFLDRDGVVVIPEFRDGRSFAPTTLESFRIYPDAAPSLARLKQAGFALVVVSNQPDIGNGLVTPALIDEMNRSLMADLPLDGIEICPHTREDDCDCRKPKPGMLQRAADRLGLKLDRSFMIGDRESDILAGESVGCRTIFVDLDYSAEPRPRSPDWTVRSVAEAANCILAANAEPRESGNASA
jgi:D-glycero-D-manno-heptose 1,7-bisphosphate phosphatase